jgi:hypothetical protein
MAEIYDLRFAIFDFQNLSARRIGLKAGESKERKWLVEKRTFALNLAFSARRRNSNSLLALRMMIRHIQSRGIPKRRQTILLLLGEKAGLREDNNPTLRDQSLAVR